MNKFLFWLSTADYDLLQNNNADKRKFQLIGLAVLCTWIFAMCAWGYFFSTISDSAIVIVASAVIMGFIVLTIDRVLISGMQSASNEKNAGPIIFRLILAMCIGTFMAQPALLYMFEKDITVQLIADKEIKKQNAVLEIQRSLEPQRAPLLKQLDSIQSLRNNLDSSVAELRASFLSEADGSGGTGKIGIAVIAKAKKTELDQVNSSLLKFNAETGPIIKKINAQLDSISEIANRKIAYFDSQSGNGFLARIDALQHLITSNPALRWRYFLLLIIIMLIELAPVLSKLLLKTNVYNQRLLLEESYQLNLDRETFEKKFHESQKFSQQIHAHNMSEIEKIIIKSKLPENPDLDPAEEFAFNSRQKPTTEGMLSYFKKKMLGRYT